MASDKRMGRRELVVGVGAAAVGAFTIGGLTLPSGRRGGGLAPSAPDVDGPTALLPAPDAGVRALFGSLAGGGVVAGGWRVEAVYGERAGAIPVVMSTPSGERFAVEVFRDDARGPAPISRADGLALTLVNRGDGASRTNEQLGLGVMALGGALHARRVEGAPIPEGLRTWRERVELRPDGWYDVPVAT